MGCSAGKISVPRSEAPKSNNDRLKERFGPRLSADLRESDIFVTFPAFFAETGQLKYFAQNYPELLLLPWEIMKKMGVIRLVNPQSIEYTYLTHQWDTAVHPWSDGSKLVENIGRVSTPYVWVDWLCAPQWSRLPSSPEKDEVACLIFKNTLRSVHRLCFHAATSMVLLKRRKHGLYSATWDISSEVNQALQSNPSSSRVPRRRKRRNAWHRRARLYLRVVCHVLSV